MFSYITKLILTKTNINAAMLNAVNTGSNIVINDRYKRSIKYKAIPQRIRFQ